MVTLAAHDYRLELSPERGGSILRFDCRGHPVFRPACGPGIFDVASFPLVPFSNRIAFGRFRDGEQEVRLSPNFPGSDHPHTLHGFGWLAPWTVADADAGSARLEHRYDAGEWPWSYRAAQRFELGPDGLHLALSVTNLSDAPMPAGLGFHPYFECDADTTYHGLHTGESQGTADGLPFAHHAEAAPVDWWKGEPVGHRSVDTVYTGRSNPLTITWPSRDLVVRIMPSDGLSYTVVYSPAQEDFFCVEPVSNATDAHNGTGARDGLVWLQLKEELSVAMHVGTAALG